MSLEVGQGPVLEPVGYPLAVDGLLADAGDHLGDVDEGPLGSGEGHDEGGVGLVQGRLGSLARRLTDG